MHLHAVLMGSFLLLLLAWDILRNGSVHRAYWIWLALALPFTVLVHGLWDTGFWHATARQIMGA